MDLRGKTIVALDFSSSSDSLPHGITQDHHLQLTVSCPVQEHLAKMGEGNGPNFNLPSGMRLVFLRLTQTKGALRDRGSL